MKPRILGALAVLCLGAASAAQADGNWLGVTSMGWQQTPGWFIAPGAEGFVQQMPRWNSTVTLHFTPPASGSAQSLAFHRTATLLGAESGLTLGYAFRDGTLPAWLGTRVRVGLTGAWQSATDTITSSTVLPQSLIQFVGVDGRRMLALLLFSGQSIGDTLRVTRDGFDLNLRAASDFPLLAGWTLTPSIAVFGGRLDDTYTYRFFVGTQSFFDINEKVKTDSLGGEFALGLTWQATHYLALNVTGRGGIVSMRSRLEASDCLGSSCAAVFAGVARTVTVTDSRSRLGLRAGASLGASLDLRIAILTVGGSITYDSDIPGVSNPTARVVTPTAGNVGTVARIRFAEGFRYSGFINLRVPLLLM